jgi:hypothetical protein
MWRGRIEEVIPVAFSPEYEPRKRALDAGEVRKLLAQLLADQAARVAFIVATSACWRETELARKEDVGEGLATVLPGHQAEDPLPQVVSLRLCRSESRGG